MSETEKGTMPPSETLVLDVNGLAQWRAEIDRISVIPIFGKKRRLSLSRNGAVVAFDLDDQQAGHLAKLLLDPHPASV